MLREDSLVRPAVETGPRERTGGESSEKQSSEKQGMVRLFFFHDPGCTECENADELLDEMQKTFPYLRTDLNTNAGIDLNESLCRRFNVSERHRMFTPSVFAGSGYLAGEDINYESLADLIRRSVHVPQLKPNVPVAIEKEQEQETVEKNGQDYRWKYFFMVLCLAVVVGFV
ncbi:MAG: hypothetical protein GY795_24720 [Desulfobacterales bacterium]|nr:hypothetical protein [Desulfobacterales bacterium]